MPISTYWHYQCLNSECAAQESVVVDVRTNKTQPNPHLACPLCNKPMVWDASSPADADGYQATYHK